VVIGLVVGIFGVRARYAALDGFRQTAVFDQLFPKLLSCHSFDKLFDRRGCCRRINFFCSPVAQTFVKIKAD
jgi:hypothetical protein